MNVSPIGPDQLELFVDVARQIRGNDPQWIPPLTRPLLRDLGLHGAAAAHMQQQLFLCLVDQKPAGRIAAFLTPRLTGADGRPIGQVGCFESVENPAVATALLHAACNWLFRHGVREVWGPMDGGAHRPHRFMTAGFEQTPFLFEPRNPPYYPELFRRCGFHEHHAWDSYDLTAEALCDRLIRQWQVDRKAARARRRHRLKFLSACHAPETLQQIHRILDELWSGHVGYYTISLEEFVEAFEGLLAILPDGYLAILESLQGTSAGLAFMYPDDANEVRRLNGDTRAWGQWRRAPLPARVILHTTALAPSARGGAALFLFLSHAVTRIRADGYRDAVLALVDRTARIRYSFAQPTRSYALFARSLS